MDFTPICRPTLLIHPVKARKNIRMMTAKAERAGARFRPHFKTHQNRKVGEIFREEGTRSITVSSVIMAEEFAGWGWKDITIAFPVNLRELESITRLSRKVDLNLLVESEEVCRKLSKVLPEETGIWIKIDSGARRTGIPVENPREVYTLASLIKQLPNLNLKGLLTHAGHSYHGASAAEIRGIFTESLSKLTSLRKDLRERGVGEMEISWGDTPTCSLVEDLSGADELRPGNFVFYDLQQYTLGSCTQEQIAAAVACPVVAIHKDRNQAVVYGGAIHLSAQPLQLADGKTIFGQVLKQDETGWGGLIPDAHVVSISQEHGVVQMKAEDIKRLQAGDILLIAPVHSCLAANLLRGNHLFIF
jgi:D-serine deaminase-like pyridoxal phosphate-dependent protein